MLPIGKAEVCRTLLIGNPECHRVYPPLPPDPLLQGTHCPLCRQPIPQREGLTEPATAHPGTIPGEAADRILGRFTRKD